MFRPATGLVEPATYPGAKPPEHPITSNVLVALTGAIDPFHAVMVAWWSSDRSSAVSRAVPAAHP